MREKDSKARHEDKGIFIVKWLEIICMDGVSYLEKKRMLGSDVRLEDLDWE